MGLWRNFLRVLGLSNDSRVQVSAPGIEVTIIGQPSQVRSVLAVVKQELERSARLRDRESRIKRLGDSQVVRPTELDEMDSPYALPEAVVVPVNDGEDTDTDAGRAAADELAAMASDPGVTEAEVRVARSRQDSDQTIADPDGLAGEWSEKQVTAADIPPHTPLPKLQAEGTKRSKLRGSMGPNRSGNGSTID